MAELLVAPKSIAVISGRGSSHYHRLRPFNEDIASIRNISVNHGIHYNGQSLTGMQIYDRPESAPGMTYEQAWADEVRRAFHSAALDKQNKVIPLAAPTLEIMCGHAAGSDVLTLENNLHSRTAEINAAIKKQHGEQIPTSKSGIVAAWRHYSCTENPKDQDQVYNFNVAYLRYGDLKSGINARYKNSHHGSTRPIALRVLALDPDFEQLVA